jgi:hypothetical protein
LERARWVERAAEGEYGFNVRELVLTHSPRELTVETFAAARASLARRTPVTALGAAYVVWLAATDADGLAEFWREAALADREAAGATFEEAWDRGFRRLERGCRRERRRAVRRISPRRPAVRCRVARGVRRGRAARPGRTRRSSVSRDDGGSGLEDPDPDGPAARAQARRDSGSGRSRPEGVRR